MSLEDFGRQNIGRLVRQNTRTAIKLIKFIKNVNLRTGPKGPPVHLYPTQTEHKVVAQGALLVPEPEVHTHVHAASHPEPEFIHHAHHHVDHLHHDHHHGHLHHGHLHHGHLHHGHHHHHGLGVHINPHPEVHGPDGFGGFQPAITEAVDQGLELIGI